LMSISNAQATRTERPSCRTATPALSVTVPSSLDSAVSLEPAQICHPIEFLAYASGVRCLHRTPKDSGLVVEYQPHTRTHSSPLPKGMDFRSQDTVLSNPSRNPVVGS